jgi:LPS export ABC transporter permease LptG/LPS export ABC transporter permease LptF
MLLDRYIIRTFILPFLIALLVFTFIQVVQPLVEHAQPLIAKGVPTGTVLRVMAMFLPAVLAITIPMSFLVALLVGLGRVSADREWVAMQACGIGMYRILRPIGLLGALAAAADAYVLIVSVPDANQAFREITFNILASRAEGEVRPRVFFDQFPNKVLYVRDTPADVQGWTDVFLADTAQPAGPVVYMAERGRLIVDRPKQTVELVLEQGTQHTTRNDDPLAYEASRFDSLILKLDPNSVFPRGAPARGEREMTIAELKARIADLQRQGQSPHNPIMEIHKKFSIPVACLVFAVIGLALGLTTRRDGKMSSFILGLGVICVYYVIMYTGQSMAKGALIPAWLAMWLPNVILGGLGVLFLIWSGRPADRWRITIPSPRRRAPDAARSSAAGPTTALPAERRGAGVVLVIRYPEFSIPRPRLIDLYVIKTYSRLFALTFLGLLALFYISTFIDLSDKLFKGTATTGMLLEYFVYATPKFVYYIIPMSTLIAVLVTIGLLTKNSELVVMKACGVSLYRLAAPLLLFAAAASLVLFGFEERVLAFANQRAETLNLAIRGIPQTIDVLNRRWMAGREGDIYHYVYFDQQANELNGLSIYRFAPEGWRLTSRTYFTKARFQGSRDETVETGTWQAANGWLREFDGGVKTQKFTPLAKADLQLETPDYFKSEQPDADRMDYGQLKRYIQELQASGFNVVPYTVALQQKLSFPFVTVIMTLIAIPFAVTTGRRGAMYGIAIGIVLAFVYWTTGSVFAAVGEGGLIAPALAAWAPNILFGAAAVYLLLTVRT